MLYVPPSSCRIASNNRDCCSSVTVRNASVWASSYSNGPDMMIATSLLGAIPFWTVVSTMPVGGVMPQAGSQSLHTSREAP